VHTHLTTSQFSIYLANSIARHVVVGLGEQRHHAAMPPNLPRWLGDLRQ
jgi:hypothetical protein